MTSTTVSTEGPERDWVFARRFAIRRMIEHGDPSAADRLPDIPDTGAMQDEIEVLRSTLADLFEQGCVRYIPGHASETVVRQARTVLGGHGTDDDGASDALG